MITIELVLVLTAVGETVIGVTAKQRSLIFPPTAPTRAQLIYGIGIPLELETESMTTGYVLKAEYFLPTKAEEFRPTKLHPQSINKRNAAENKTFGYHEMQDKFDLRTENKKFESNANSLSEYRWAVYKGIEMVAERMGLDGRACMLRSICEASEVPFHYESGILAELMHIIMTPSSSVDTVQKYKDFEYYQAEVLGKSGAPCGRIFKECDKSIINYFSEVF